MRRIWVLLAAVLMLVGCSISAMVWDNGERYLQPGALDSPLSGIYSVYSFKFMERYRVTYEWVSSSGCGLLGIRLPRAPGGVEPVIYEVPDIYEEGGKTWQASLGHPPWDLDRWVRSVKTRSKVKGEEGKLVEIGLKTLCEEGWWSSSHYLFIRLRRATLEALQQEVTDASKGVPIHWTSRTLNGMEWRVMEVPLDQLRERRLNAIGAPYQTWITPLGDTGYVLALSLGASKESLAYPRAHAAFEATFQHLLHAVKVEPLPP